jgi:hypothetical protein
MGHSFLLFCFDSIQGQFLFDLVGLGQSGYCLHFPLLSLLVPFQHDLPLNKSLFIFLIVVLIQNKVVFILLKELLSRLLLVPLLDLELLLFVLLPKLVGHWSVTSFTDVKVPPLRRVKRVGVPRNIALLLVEFRLETGEVSGFFLVYLGEHSLPSNFVCSVLVSLQSDYVEVVGGFLVGEDFCWFVLLLEVSQVFGVVVEFVSDWVEALFVGQSLFF